MDEKLRRADPHAERINVPAIPNYYWRYRMHLTLEMLQKADSFQRRTPAAGGTERKVNSSIAF